MNSNVGHAIEYDVRTSWTRGDGWSSRALTAADHPGLRAIRDRTRIRALVVPDGSVDDPGWAIEYDNRLVGAIAARRTPRATQPTPHPWSRTEDAPAGADRASLEIRALFWEHDCQLDAVEVIVEVVCNAVQLESLTEARVELPIAADDPTEWLMMLHADARASRWDDEPIAVFLRAGFYLQGWFCGPSGAPRARLNWPNRAR